MSRRARAAAAVVLALAAGSAGAFVRTRDATTGNAVAWPIPVVPYHVNPTWPDAITSPSCLGDVPVAEVRAGFSQWEQDCTDLRLLFGGPLSETATGLGGSHENVVVFRRGWCSQRAPASDSCWSTDDCDTRYNCFDDNCAAGATQCPSSWGILAQTSVLYDPASGRIFDADMELNGWDGTDAPIPPTGTKPIHGWYFTCWEPDQPSTTCGTYGEPACKYIDLRNTVTHEAGHFLGLKHPCGDPGEVSCTDPSPAPSDWVSYAQRTMYPYSSAGDVAKRDLSPDDRAGVCDIYPRQSGGCGCGGGGAAGALSLLVAALALRPLSGPRGPRTPRPPRRPR